MKFQVHFDQISYVNFISLIKYFSSIISNQIKFIQKIVHRTFNNTFFINYELFQGNLSDKIKSAKCPIFKTNFLNVLRLLMNTSKEF